MASSVLTENKTVAYRVDGTQALQQLRSLADKVGLLCAQSLDELGHGRAVQLALDNSKFLQHQCTASVNRPLAIVAERKAN